MRCERAVAARTAPYPAPFDVATHAPTERTAEETAEARRARLHADRVVALLEPLDGVELGAYDRRILDWLAGWDVGAVGTIASLLYRARAAADLP